MSTRGSTFPSKAGAHERLLRRTGRSSAVGQEVAHLPVGVQRVARRAQVRLHRVQDGRVSAASSKSARA